VNDDDPPIAATILFLIIVAAGFMSTAILVWSLDRRSWAP
jgi:hypothetical protein